MSANVETMFAVGDTPWHGLGTVLPKDRILSVKEALELAGFLSSTRCMMRTIRSNRGER